MKLWLLLLFVSVVLLLPIQALACACCSEQGAYQISTRKPVQYELDELKKIRFASTKLYTTDAGDDIIKGINPLNQDYTLSGLLQGNSWKFDFKDDKGQRGSLNLPMPTSMVAFSADIHDGPGDRDPVLYKELRFKSKAQGGTGIFKNGIVPATDYFLVLQGRGNNCLDASDFTHWRLEITGKKANYAFFGQLKAQS